MCQVSTCVHNVISRHIWWHLGPCSKTLIHIGPQGGLSELQHLQSVNKPWRSLKMMQPYPEDTIHHTAWCNEERDREAGIMETCRFMASHIRTQGACVSDHAVLEKIPWKDKLKQTSELIITQIVNVPLSSAQSISDHFQVNKDVINCNSWPQLGSIRSE